MTYRPNPGYQVASQSSRNDDIRRDRDMALPENLVDTTNLAIATHEYPSATGAAMLPSKDLSLTGKIIDINGTVTVTVWATNDEDLAAGDWHNVTYAGYRTDGHLPATGNASITVTNGTEEFAIDFDNLNYDYYKVQVICAGSATNTVIVKQRKKAL